VKAAKNTEVRASTGIAGLDDVLGGGLPANHLYLVEGEPGTGKTTIALQFLLEGERRGERGLYITLSETVSELRTVAESHGWSLDGIALFELASLEQRLQAENEYTVFHPADVELGEITRPICEQVEKLTPARVVFDSLSEMRLLARDSLRYRRQILALKQFFAGRQCTTVLLDDLTSEHTDLQLQSICHGVILLDRMSVNYGGARRRLTVAKMRGLKFLEGYHDLAIDSGGAVVYPRLVASLHNRSFTDAAHRPVASSGIAGIDALLGGGIHYGTSTLVVGPAGSGKSTLLAHYAVTLARNRKRVAIYVFEETAETFVDRSEGLGMGMRAHIADGTVIIQQVDPAEMPPGEFTYKVRKATEVEGVEGVLIDSLNGYLNAMPNENFLLLQLHELLTYLNQRGKLTFLVLAQHGLFGRMDSPVDVTYLADTVIVLRYFEAFGEVRQALAVIKKRTGKHERSIRQFHLTPLGIQIGQPLTDFEGILTGIPIYKGTREELLGNTRT